MARLDTHSAQSTTGPPSAWSRHPKASIHRHRKLLGLSPETIVSPPDLWLERALPTDCIDATTVRLAAALHAFVQCLCEDEESLVGILYREQRESGEVLLAASYVYAEPDDDASSIASQAMRCLERMERIDAEGVSALTATANAPAFFVLHADGIEAPPAPVLVQAVRDGATATLRLGIAPEVRRFPAAAAALEAIEISLRAMIAGDAVTLGTLSARLEGLLAWPDAEMAAHDDIMRAIAEVWAELLKVDAAGIVPQTSYFELGGTSLNAFKLVAMMRSRFEVEINIRDIIDHDRLQAFAALVDEKRRSG